MAQDGAQGYVLINYDGKQSSLNYWYQYPLCIKFLNFPWLLGIPVKMFPEPDEEGNGLPAVQYAALMADLVMKTKQTLASLFPDQGGQFTHLRLRTAQDTEYIVTDVSKDNNEYILCAIQNCKVTKDEEGEEGEAAKE